MKRTAVFIVSILVMLLGLCLGASMATAGDEKPGTEVLQDPNQAP